MRLIQLPVTTDGDGDGSFTADGIPGGGVAIHFLEYFPGDIDTGATITITDEFNGGSFTVWVKASAGTTNIRVFPRVLEALNTDGSALATHTHPTVCGRPKITVASGGDTKTGMVVIHGMEL